MLTEPVTLSPAQKAWITRRAKMATRPVAAPAPKAEPDWMKPRQVAEIPQLEPVTELRMVEINVDHRLLGCGQRRFVVLDMSAREVRLFYAPLLTTITIPRKVFNDRHAPAKRVKRDVLADIIRRKIALADSINAAKCKLIMSDGGQDAQRALALAVARR
jgi:hypothetical protein